MQEEKDETEGIAVGEEENRGAKEETDNEGKR